MNSRGLSLPELVVALAVVLMVTAVVTVLLLGHVNRSHSARAVSDIVSLRDALQLALVHEDANDLNHNGDLIDDLIARGYLDKTPTAIPGATWQLKKVEFNGLHVFYVKIYCATDVCDENLSKLDREMDNSNGPNEGLIQWT